MTQETSKKDKNIWNAMDARVRRVDEDRWLSSRYAPSESREALIGLYAFNYELARVRNVVSEDTLGAIRFQWWREALDEIEAGKPVREHEVANGLEDLVHTQRLKTAALHKLVDGYETAFQSQDRAHEPEGWLMAVAANILTPRHGWGEAIREVAPYYAAARRGESKAFGPILPSVPSTIRPAIAHVRLRRLYTEGKQPGRLKKRFVVLRGVMRGEV